MLTKHYTKTVNTNTLYLTQLYSSHAELEIDITDQRPSSDWDLIQFMQF